MPIALNYCCINSTIKARLSAEIQRNNAVYSCTSMANTLQADFLSACLMATSRPSRSWCWITKARTGHWKFLSPLLREPWAEISLDSSGEGCLSREDPTSKWGTKQVDVREEASVILEYHYSLHRWLHSITCITTMDPASGHSFNSGWRRWVLLVILRCNNRVRSLKHCTFRCITVCDRTSLKTERENIRINPSQCKCSTKTSVCL